MIKLSKTTEKPKMKTDSIPFPHLHSHFPKVTTPNNFSGTPEPAERNAALILVISVTVRPSRPTLLTSATIR